MLEQDDTFAWIFKIKQEAPEHFVMESLTLGPQHLFLLSSAIRANLEKFQTPWEPCLGLVQAMEGWSPRAGTGRGRPVGGR